MVLYTLDGTPTDTLTIEIQPSIVELERLNIPTLGTLPKVAKSQEQIRWDVNVGGATAVGESSNAAVTTFSEDAVKLAYLPITDRFRASFEIEAKEYATAEAAARMGSPDKFSNLLLYKSQAAQREILRDMGQWIFNGDGSQNNAGMIGLETTIATVVSDKSTVPYAGLSPGTYPKWTSLVKPSFGNITKRKLRNFESDLRSGKTLGTRSSYNALIMHPDTASYFMEVFDESTVVNASYRDVADLGYRGLAYAGRPVLEDPNCAENTIHFLDTTQVRLCIFDLSRPEYFGDEIPIDGITMYIKELPSDNPEKAKLVIYTKAQMQLEDRTAFASIKGITETTP